MKKIYLILTLFALNSNTSRAQTVGIGTQTPDSSAQLDVYSSTKGFLPPRVALTATNIANPVINPATGLLVFNTATSGGTPTNVSPGYYYWNGTNWVPMVNKGYSPGDMQYWDGSRWIMIPLGLNGQVLTICNGIPQWGPCFNRITIQPSQNPYEGYIENFNPNDLNTGTQIDMAAWTSGGQPLFQRTVLKFDFSAIPVSATIDSARLYLYATTTPLGGNGVDAHFGSSNNSVIRRITTAWTTPAQFSWNNPPAVTNTHEAIIPQSTASFENNIIDVTALISDMLVSGNNGFAINLQNEVAYNIRQYASSKHSDITKHPKLIIYYH